MQSRFDGEALASLSGPVRALRLKDVPLDGAPETLELERFQVFAPDVEIIAYGAGGHTERLPVPDVQYFRGKVAGDPDSLVFLSVSASRAEGFAFKGERRFAFGSQRRAALKGARKAYDYDVVVDEVQVSDEMAVDGSGFTCDIERAPLEPAPLAALAAGGSGLKPKAAGALATGTARWLLNLAIDTDYELYVNAGSTSANVTTYIGNLAGAVGTIYRRDLTTDVLVTFLGIQTNIADPFTANPGASGTWNGAPTTFTTAHALAELGDRWHNTPPSSARRSSALLISGKTQGAGVAWLGTLCGGDFSCNNGSCGSTLFNGHYGGAYAYIGAVFPPVDLTVPNPDANAPLYTAPGSNYWSILATSHELGHNVGSEHTHCIVLSPADQSTYGRVYVDNCYASEGGCTSGPVGVPFEKGTIMSYCHLNGGGAQTRYLFGKTGEASHVVPESMRSQIQTKTPSMSSITLSAASLPGGGAGTASVVNVGGGVTYNWSINGNGTINSGATTNAITFTANTNPVVLTVRATNTSGCSVTDTVSVAVTSNCTYSMSVAGFVHGASETTGSFTINTQPGCAWTASTTSNFVTVVSGAGIGTGSVNYTMTVNNTAAQRVATIINSGGAFTVRQDPPAVASNGDFNSDGKPDVIWRNESNGQNLAWFVSNLGQIGYAYFPSQTDPNWKLVGAGDFNSDGKTDLFWRNVVNGQNAVWFMNGAAVIGAGYPPTLADTNWFVEGIGDFTSDGKPDVIWHNHATGRTVLWIMNGVAQVGFADWGSPALPWHPVFAGDFNGDGQTDIFWRNGTTGENLFWQMSGLAQTGYTVIPTLGTQWKAAATADYSGDGRPDILWHNTTTGEPVAWFISNYAYAGWGAMSTVTDLNWRIAGPK